MLLPASPAACRGSTSSNCTSFVSCQGFGEPSSEFWLGNEFIFRLTTLESYKLRIELSDWEGNAGFSQYDQFSLDGEAQNYRYIELTTSKE